LWVFYAAAEQGVNQLRRRHVVGILAVLAFVLFPVVLRAGKTLKIPALGSLATGKKAPPLASWDLNDRVVTLAAAFRRN